MRTDSRTVRKMTWVNLLILFILLSVSLVAGASDQEKKASSEWKEVMSFRSEYEHMPPVWCGSKAVVVAMSDPRDYWDKGRGGVVYVDVEKKKVRWITKHVAKDPFCSFDCSSVFYYSFWDEVKGKEIEEGEEGSLWKFDLKTGGKKKLIAAPTDCMAKPASPTGKIYVLARCYENSPLASALDLPGWKILTIPKDSNRSEGSPKWARDGSYLVTSVYDKMKNRSLIFYDMDGKVTKEVQFNLRFPEITALLALSDGVYFLNRNDGSLRRVSSKTWEIEDLPLQVPYDKTRGMAFDISPQGEIVFDRRDLGGSLWIQPIMGGKATKLCDDGHAPVFSDTGEYLAFNKDSKGDERESYSRLVVLKRKGKKR